MVEGARRHTFSLPQCNLVGVSRTNCFLFTILFLSIYMPRSHVCAAGVVPPSSSTLSSWLKEHSVPRRYGMIISVVILLKSQSKPPVIPTRVFLSFGTARWVSSGPRTESNHLFGVHRMLTNRYYYSIKLSVWRKVGGFSSSSAFSIQVPSRG